MKWQTRLDHYVKSGDNKLSATSIIYNILVIVLILTFLTTVLAIKLLRDLNKNSKARLFWKTNRKQKNLLMSKTNWINLSGDVFRKPAFA